MIRRSYDRDGDPASDRVLDALLAAARPADPSGRDAEETAVRVLARVAALAEPDVRAVVARPVARPTPRRVRRGVARAAAVVAAVAVALSTGWRSAPHVADAPVAADTVAVTLDRTIAGDAAAARALSDLGPSGRLACLERAAREGPDAAAALAWFGRLGGPRGAPEAERLADLASLPSLREGALDLLARAGGDSGARVLGDLLVDDGTASAKDLASADSVVATPSTPPASPALSAPSEISAPCEIEEPVVKALRSVAAEGRPGLALEALRRGVAAGRPLAAAASLRIGGTSEVERLLKFASARVLADAAVGAALRDASETVRQAWLKRVERGDEKALDAAAAARLPGLPAVLVARFRDAKEAVAAVHAVDDVGGPEAWRTLPLALDGPADADARVALRDGPPDAARVFLDAALERGGASAAPYLAALAEIGDAGLDPLVDLVGRPCLAQPAVEALATSRSGRASEALAGIGSRAAMTLPAVAALARRLRAGDRSAADALLSLARDGAARPALEALAASGEAGHAALKVALLDARLRVAAAEAVDRAEGGSPGRSTKRGREPATHS